IGDAVHLFRELRIAPGFYRPDDTRPLAMAFVEPAVEQLADRIEPFRIAELRQSEDEIRPLALRRQIVPDECVAMRRCDHLSFRRQSGLLAPASQRLSCDHDLLHLRRALVDAQRPDLPVKLLDLDALGDAEPAMELYGAVDHMLRRLGGEH